MPTLKRGKPSGTAYDWKPARTQSMRRGGGSSSWARAKVGTATRNARAMRRMRDMTMLWLLALIAAAGRLPATGTPLTIFLFDGLIQINLQAVGQRRQPGEHVGELEASLLVGAAAQGGGELADLLHEPHEGPLDAAFAVLGVVGFAND